MSAIKRALPAIISASRVGDFIDCEIVSQKFLNNWVNWSKFSGCGTIEPFSTLPIDILVVKIPSL